MLSYRPIPPSACCLELLLAMAAHPNLLLLTKHANGLRFLELLLVNSGLCAALLLNSALRVEANARWARL